MSPERRTPPHPPPPPRCSFSTQPISTFDWNTDKEGLCVMGCLDQTIRVLICTKLNLL